MPVGPGPSFTGPVAAGGLVMTVVLGEEAGTTKPAAGGGLAPKYDGGGTGLGDVCSYGGGRPILFSTRNYNKTVEKDDVRE